MRAHCRDTHPIHHRFASMRSSHSERFRFYFMVFFSVFVKPRHDYVMMINNKVIAIEWPKENRVWILMGMSTRRTMNLKWKTHATHGQIPFTFLKSRGEVFFYENWISFCFTSSPSHSTFLSTPMQWYTCLLLPRLLWVLAISYTRGMHKICKQSNYFRIHENVSQAIIGPFIRARWFANSRWVGVRSMHISKFAFVTPLLCMKNHHSARWDFTRF